MFGFPGLFVYATQWSQPKVDLVYVSLLPRIRVLTRLQFPVSLDSSLLSTAVSDILMLITCMF